MSKQKQLERFAVHAFEHGESWNTFWDKHAAAIKAAEPYDAGRYRRLYQRLLHLLTCGDTNGMMPVADDDATPWEADDAEQTADVGTQARFDWAVGQAECTLAPH